MGEQHELEPDRVGVEVAEREVGQAAVLGGADGVLDTCAGTVAALQDGDVGVGLVGQDRLEAVPLVVDERQLRTGMRALAAHDHPGTVGPARQVQATGELGDLAVLARRAVRVKRRGPGFLGQGEDREPDRLGEIEPDAVADLAVAAELQQLVRQPGRVGPYHDRLGLDDVARKLFQRVGENGDVVTRVV